MKCASVLMLHYNSPDLIGAVDSVLSQSYPDIQLVIVDDCSDSFDKERLAEYIRQHNCGNVTTEIIANPENLGTVRSSNLGMSRTHGDFIINLAGDDRFYDNNVVTDIMAEYERTGAMVITGLRSVCDEKLENELSVLPNAQQIKLMRTLSPQELFEEMSGSNFIFGCCTGRSRECIEKYGNYDERYRLLDDYSLIMKLLRNGVAVHFMDRRFIRYRSGGVSSAEKIGDSYFSEADMLFENDILPYSKNKKLARKRYDSWKQGVLLEKEYHRKRQAAGSKFELVAVKVLFNLAHPKRAVAALKYRASR